MNSKHYWLYLHPFVYLSHKPNRALLYNTLNGKMLEYGKNSRCLKILRNLDSDENLYVVKLKAKHINEETETFINAIREAYMGDLVDTEQAPGKPVQLKPIPDLHKTFEEMSEYGENERILAKDEIKDYLNVLTLYIQNDCPHNCRECSTAFKQFHWCGKAVGLKKNRQGITLPIEEIRSLMQQTKNSGLYLAGSAPYGTFFGKHDE